MCLTRLQPLLRPESPIHGALFWVSISILQLDEISLYASGMALLEQNLLTLEYHGAFRDEEQQIDKVMLQTREPLEWYFKQLDHSVGLSFKVSIIMLIECRVQCAFPPLQPPTALQSCVLLYNIFSILYFRAIFISRWLDISLKVTDIQVK